MNQPQAQVDNKPWYKYFWPWFLICVPLTSMIFTANYVKLALSGEDSLVVDDYYKEGRGINARLDKIERAKRLTITTDLFITDNSVSVNFLTGAPKTGEALNLHFYHVTLDTKDFSVLLTRDANGIYRATLPNDVSGKWRISMTPLDEVWKIQRTVQLPQRQPFSFNP
ncbi:MAG: FixH family protein [Glaciecola sp.]|jgi:hypothetical protein